MKAVLFSKNGILVALFLFTLYLSLEKGMVTTLVVFCLCCAVTIPLRIYIDSYAKTLIAFSLLYCIGGFINGVFNSPMAICLNALPWLFFYLFGKYMTSIFNKIGVMAFFVIALAISSYMILFSTTSTILNTGSLINDIRLISFMGDEERMYSPTQILCRITANVAGIAGLIYIKNKFLKYSFLGLGILTIMAAISTLTRAPIVVAVFCFLPISLIYYKQHKSRIFLCIAVCSIVFFVLNKYGVLFEFSDAISDRNDSISSMGGRSSKWVEALSLAFTEPFGWWTVSNANQFAHNMWLDMCKMGGIIPSAILFFTSIKMFFINKQIIKQNMDELSLFLLSLNICFFLSLFQEPVTSGVYPLLYVMLWGVTIGCKEKYYQS